MTYVAFETSARRPSLAVRAGERVLSRELSSDRAHASDLLPTLDLLLRELQVAPADIRAVCVGTGPGSYTGLRVGIATALGLARANGAALLGVPSGDTLAFGELAPGAEAATLIDARQGELYFARYRRTDDEVLVVHAPCVIQPGELAALLPPAITIFAEPGALRLARGGPHAPRDVEPLYLRPFAARTRRR